MFAFKKTGDALEILCSAPGCGRSYVEILSDRMLIYDYHYNREHMTVIYPDAMRKLWDAMRGESPTRIHCDCGRLPCAIAGRETLTFEPKHKVQLAGGGVRSERHKNVWEVGELVIVCRWLGLIDDMMLTDSTVVNLEVKGNPVGHQQTT